MNRIDKVIKDLRPMNGSNEMDEAVVLIEELRDALLNMVGAFDTPIARRRIYNDFATEARKSAREILSDME